MGCGGSVDSQAPQDKSDTSPSGETPASDASSPEPVSIVVGGNKSSSNLDASGAAPTAASSQDAALDGSAAAAAGAAVTMYIKLKNVIGVETVISCTGDTFGDLQSAVTAATRLAPEQQHLVMSVSNNRLDFAPSTSLGSCGIQDGTAIIYSKRKEGVKAVQGGVIITLIAKSVVGQEETIEMTQESPISAIADPIQKAFQIEACDQRLLHDGRSLTAFDPETTLVDCGLKDGSVIMVARNRSLSDL